MAVAILVMFDKLLERLSFHMSELILELEFKWSLSS